MAMWKQCRQYCCCQYATIQSVVLFIACVVIRFWEVVQMQLTKQLYVAIGHGSTCFVCSLVECVCACKFIHPYDFPSSYTDQNAHNIDRKTRPNYSLSICNNQRLPLQLDVELDSTCKGSTASTATHTTEAILYVVSNQCANQCCRLLRTKC